jgi:hypothetical protein
LSPNHDYCIRCGYSEKDAIADNAGSEIADRINRLESILTELLDKLNDKRGKKRYSSV